MMEERYMENLYYIGQDLLYFAVALLGTQIMWIAGKLIKDKEKKLILKPHGTILFFPFYFYCYIHKLV